MLYFLKKINSGYIFYEVNPKCLKKMLIDKPQLNPEAKAKSKAKSWAEVVYIITVPVLCPSQSRAHPHPETIPVLHIISTASTISLS